MNRQRCIRPTEKHALQRQLHTLWLMRGSHPEAQHLLREAFKPS